MRDAKMAVGEPVLEETPPEPAWGDPAARGVTTWAPVEEAEPAHATNEVPVSDIVFHCAGGDYEGHYNAVMAHKSRHKTPACAGEIVAVLDAATGGPVRPEPSAPVPEPESGPPEVEEPEPGTRMGQARPTLVPSRSHRFSATLYALYDFARTHDAFGAGEVFTGTFDEFVEESTLLFWEQLGYKMAVVFEGGGGRQRVGEPVPLRAA